MVRFKSALPLALLLSAAAALTSCDNGPSAVAGKQAAGTQMAAAEAPRSSAPAAAGDDAPAVDHRQDPVPELDGKPMWSASRRMTAEESAQRAFDRNGEAFGAKDLKSFVRKAHAFVDHPPAGTETLTRRNGDTLFYDAKGNVFAVANKDGAPRTMFKPDDGPAYWRQQKDRAERQQQSARRRTQADDEA